MIADSLTLGSDTFQCRAASVRWLQVTSQIISKAVIEHIRVMSYVAGDLCFGLR